MVFYLHFFRKKYPNIMISLNFFNKVVACFLSKKSCHSSILSLCQALRTVHYPGIWIVIRIVVNNRPSLVHLDRMIASECLVQDCIVMKPEASFPVL